MDILVIGNGFDLAHGLPTHYDDFLEFMNNLDKCEMRDKNLLGDLKNCKENNFWLKYFNKNKKYVNNNWVDFEAEIAKVIKSMDYAKYISDNIRKNQCELFDFTRDLDKENIYEEVCKWKDYKYAKEIYPRNGTDSVIYISNIKYYIKMLSDDLNELDWCLEIYLNKVMEDIDKAENSIKRIPELIDKKFDRVLSFNYTNTFEKLKYKLNLSVNYEEQIDYIHGKVDLEKHKTRDDNNMVLGIDEYLDEDERNVKLDFIKFKKYFQRIYKRTGNEYTKWIEEINTNTSLVAEVEGFRFINNIYIFGHSLDVSDKDILKSLILESSPKLKNGLYNKKTQITIYYYNEEAYAQQITNLVKIIGQDELISRVSGKNPTIIFKKQS